MAQITNEMVQASYDIGKKVYQCARMAKYVIDRRSLIDFISNG